MTLTDDVVERVARAIYRSQSSGHELPDKDHPAQTSRHISLRSARAALEAARYGELRAGLKRAEQFIRDLATTDTLIMADTLEAEADRFDALLSTIGEQP